MLVICPACSARYRVDAMSATLPRSGRDLRCGQCGNIWQAIQVDRPAKTLPAMLALTGRAPVEELPRDERPPLPHARLASHTSGEAGWGDASGRGCDADVPPAYRAALAITAAQSLTKGSCPGRAFVLAILLVVIGAGLHYRHDVVIAAPAAAGLYALAGLPVNLYGLDFRNIKSHRGFDDGLPVLVVEGEIVNLRNVPSEVPAIRIAVRGEAGESLYSWRVEPPQRMVEANDAVTLRSRLAAPPGGAVEVELRFDRGSAPGDSGLRS